MKKLMNICKEPFRNCNLHHV